MVAVSEAVLGVASRVVSGEVLVSLLAGYLNSTELRNQIKCKTINNIVNVLTSHEVDGKLSSLSSSIYLTPYLVMQSNEVANS